MRLMAFIFVSNIVRFTIELSTVSSINPVEDAKGTTPALQLIQVPSPRRKPAVSRISNLSETMLTPLNNTEVAKAGISRACFAEYLRRPCPTSMGAETMIAL